MYDGMIVGMMKRKLEKYKKIVAKLIGKQPLDDEEIVILRKDDIVK